MKTPAPDRFAKNTTFVFLARGSELVSGLVTVGMAARYLGVHGFGKYAFVWAIAQAFSALIAFGSQRIVIREVSVEKNQAAAFVTSGLILNTVMAVVVFIVATVIIFVLDEVSKEMIISLYLAIFAQMLMTMTRTVSTVFMAYERMSYDFIITILTRLSVILFTVAAIFFNLGLVGLFVALVLADAMGLAYAGSILTIKFGIKPKQNIDMAQLKYVIKESFPVALSTFVGQGYRYINVFFLKIFQSFSEVSLFQAPQRVISPLLMFPMSFLFAFAPALSRMGNDDNSSALLEYSYDKTLKFFLIISLAIGVYGTMFAHQITLLLFGNDFSNATRSFQIMIWVMVPFFINALDNFVLTSIKKQKVLVISNLSAFLVNCVLGYILIPRYGHIGASLSFLLSAVALCISNFYHVNVFLGRWPNYKILCRPLLACSILFLVLFLLIDKVNMFLLVPLSAAFYFALLLLFKNFSSDEIAWFKSIFAKF